MVFKGIKRTFSHINDCQYETIGEFWDELSAKYGGVDKLIGLEVSWNDETMDYAIGLKEGVIEGHNITVNLPDEGWQTISGLTIDLKRIYKELISRGGYIEYALETFAKNGRCMIQYIRRDYEVIQTAQLV